LKNKTQKQKLRDAIMVVVARQSLARLGDIDNDPLANCRLRRLKN
jgi:hypothetical protein